MRTTSSTTTTALVPLHHGGLVLDVPAGWSDQSTLLVVAPPPPAAPTANASAAVAETVSIRFVGLDGRDAATIVRDEVQALQQMAASVTAGDVSDFVCGLGKGARLDARLGLNGLEIAQVAIAVVLAETAVVGVGVCTAARAEQVQPTLVAMLRSLRTSTTNTPSSTSQTESEA